MNYQYALIRTLSAGRLLKRYACPVLSGIVKTSPVFPSKSLKKKRAPCFSENTPLGNSKEHGQEALPWAALGAPGAAKDPQGPPKDPQGPPPGAKKDHQGLIRTHSGLIRTTVGPHSDPFRPHPGHSRASFGPIQASSGPHSHVRPVTF